MAEKNGLDLELQAVENIPRDTLVALLRRKDKELKAQQLKIEKLEERYVKVVRFNKILTEDRQAFQRFCHELLPECDGAFEEAAAQETAADLQELLRQLAEWRRHGNAAHEDRKVFQQFLDLIFPNDEAIAGLFARPSMGEGAFDLLQTKWMKLEDLHNQSISSINAMAHDQALAQQEDLYAAQRAQLEAEKKIQALQDELAGMAREKAQVLKQKLDGKSTGSGDAEQVASISKDPREQRALEEEKAAAERREREAWQSLDRQREAMQASIDELRAEARRLRLDLERERCEAELHRCEAEKRLEDKENALSQMRLKTGELEQELTSTDSITRLAEQQALREVEMKKHQQKVQQANQSLLEVQKMLEMSYAQEKVLKDRIRELESSQGRSHMSGDYLKHVVLKYIEYCQKGDMKSQSLVPVLCTLLNLNAAERKLVEHSSIPAPLQHLNQAAGAAGAWFRGSNGEDESSHS